MRRRSRIKAIKEARSNVKVNSGRWQGGFMKKQKRVLRLNLSFAKAIWGQLPKTAQHELQELTAKYGLSVPLGDVKYMENRWYVTHAGLLRLAQRRRCAGIKVQQVRDFCEPTTGRWVFKATLYKNRFSQGVVGYGDADPSQQY